MHVSRVIRQSVVTVLVAVSAAGCSKSAQTYLERGNAQLEKGNVDAAVLEYRNAVAKDAMFAPARLKLAEAYLRQGNGAGALAESVRAADLLPNDVDAQLKAGALLLLARRSEDAKSRADKALAVDPKNVDALVLRANALAGLTDLDAALKEMQEAVSLDPRSAFQTNLGFIQAARGNLPEAEAAFRQAVATDPKSVTAHVALGQFLWLAGKAREAEGAFKAALALEPGSIVANHALAALYLRTDRGAEAEPYLKKTAEVSGAVEAKLALADYYVGLKRPAAAAQQPRGPARPRVQPPRTRGPQPRGGGHEDPPRAGAPGGVGAESSRNARAGERREHQSPRGVRQGPVARRTPGGAPLVSHLGLAYAQTGDKALARESLGHGLRLKPDFDGAEDARKVLSALAG